MTKDTGCEVWAICCGLARKKGLGNLCPGRVGRDGDEVVCMAKKAGNSHGVIEQLLHVTITPLV